MENNSNNEVETPSSDNLSPSIITNSYNQEQGKLSDKILDEFIDKLNNLHSNLEFKIVENENLDFSKPSKIFTHIIKMSNGEKSMTILFVCGYKNYKYNPHIQTTGEKFISSINGDCSRSYALKCEINNYLKSSSLNEKIEELMNDQ